MAPLTSNFTKIWTFWFSCTTTVFDFELPNLALLQVILVHLAIRFYDCSSLLNLKIHIDDSQLSTFYDASVKLSFESFIATDLSLCRTIHKSWPPYILLACRHFWQWIAFQSLQEQLQTRQTQALQAISLKANHRSACSLRNSTLYLYGVRKEYHQYWWTNGSCHACMGVGIQLCTFMSLNQFQAHCYPSRKALYLFTSWIWPNIGWLRHRRSICSVTTTWESQYRPRNQKCKL